MRGRAGAAATGHRADTVQWSPRRGEDVGCGSRLVVTGGGGLQRQVHGGLELPSTAASTWGGRVGETVGPQPEAGLPAGGR